MASRLPRCLQHGLSEIEISVQMRSSQKKTVRPYAPLLQFVAEGRDVSCRIGGSPPLTLFCGGQHYGVMCVAERR